MSGPMRLLLAALLIGAMLVPAAEADWPSFHNDARKTGLQGGTEYQVYRDVWWSKRIPDNATVESSPVVASGILVIGGWDKVVRAYDAASGTPKWNYTMTDKIVAPPAVQAGRVYAVDIKGALVSLDLQTGRKYAETSVGATYAPVTAHEGKLFIGTEDGLMKAFEVKSSDSVITALWTFNVNSFRTESMSSSGTACSHSKGQIRGAAAVHDGLVYFGAMNNFVYAINAEGESDDTVRAQWFNQTGDIILGSPSVDITNSRVYVASYDGKLRAFTLSRPNPDTCIDANRVPVWIYSAPANAQMRSSPAIDGASVFIGTNSGRVLAISANNGVQLWNRGTGDQVVSSPAVANGIVVVGSDDKNVYWLAAHNGSILKQFAAESAIKSSPAIDGARAFVVSFDGTIYMFGPEIPRRADLIVESISESGGTLSIVVKNQGDAASAATTVRLLQGGTFVANIAIQAIDPGQTRTVTQPVTLTATATFKAIADPDGLVTESTESNNEKEQSLSPPAPPADEVPEDEEGGGGGGLKIPAPGLGLALLAVALAVALLGRRR